MVTRFEAADPLCVPAPPSKRKLSQYLASQQLEAAEGEANGSAAYRRCLRHPDGRVEFLRQQRQAPVNSPCQDVLEKAGKLMQDFAQGVVTCASIKPTTWWQSRGAQIADSLVPSIRRALTPIGERVVQQLNGDCSVLGLSSFWDQWRHSDCLLRALGRGEMQATGAGIYAIVSIRGTEVTALYIGKARNLLARTAQHGAQLANRCVPAEATPRLVYQLGKAAQRTLHLPLLRLESSKGTEELLAVAEALFCAACGSYCQSAEWLRLRSQYGLPALPDSIAGANSTPCWEPPSRAFAECITSRIQDRHYNALLLRLRFHLVQAAVALCQDTDADEESDASRAALSKVQSARDQLRARAKELLVQGELKLLPCLQQGAQVWLLGWTLPIALTDRLAEASTADCLWSFWLSEGTADPRSDLVVGVQEARRPLFQGVKLYAQVHEAVGKATAAASPLPVQYLGSGSAMADAFLAKVFSFLPAESQATRRAAQSGLIARTHQLREEYAWDDLSENAQAALQGELCIIGGARLKLGHTGIKLVDQREKQLREAEDALYSACGFGIRASWRRDPDAGQRHYLPSIPCRFEIGPSAANAFAQNVFRVTPQQWRILVLTFAGEWTPLPFAVQPKGSGKRAETDNLVDIFEELTRCRKGVRLERETEVPAIFRPDVKRAQRTASAANIVISMGGKPFSIVPVPKATVLKVLGEWPGQSGSYLSLEVKIGGAGSKQCSELTFEVRKPGEGPWESFEVPAMRREALWTKIRDLRVAHEAANAGAAMCDGVLADEMEKLPESSAGPKKRNRQPAAGPSKKAK